MKFNKSLSIFIIVANTLLIKAEKVSFKVLAVNGTPYLSVGGNKYEMTLKEYPLYKAEIEVDNFPVEYNYGIVYADGNAEQEAFTRKRNQEEKALNEFFNRQVTIVEHPKLPKAYESFEYFVPSKLYDDSHVDTVIVKCDPNTLQMMYQNPNDKTLEVPAEVVYASPYSVKTFKQAVFSIAGQSTRLVPKLSYKIKNLNTEDNKELYNRTSIKLRAEHMDPSFLRDKIYGDILNSLGVPAAQNKFARLFINGEAIGLFNLSDDITNNRYLRETFNKGEKYNQENPIYKADYCAHCSVGAVYGDLGFYGEDANNPMYSIYTYKGKDETMDKVTHIARDIIPLVKEIDNYKTGITQECPIDIDTFLKYMVLEFLAGAIDNYWSKPGNYFLFKDSEKNKWYFHDADFHYSLGVGGKPEIMIGTPLAQYPPGFDDVDTARPPLDAILSHPEHKTKFLEIFQRLFSTSFHKEALYPRIESLASLIREDVEWDFGIPRVSQSENQVEADIIYNIDDFNTHINSEEGVSRYGTVPIKFFINSKIDLVSNELNIQIPQTIDNSLGYVDNPSQLKATSSSSKTVTWSIFTSFIILFVTFILY